MGLKHRRGSRFTGLSLSVSTPDARAKQNSQEPELRTPKMRPDSSMQGFQSFLHIVSGEGDAPTRLSSVGTHTPVNVDAGKHHHNTCALSSGGDFDAFKKSIGQLNPLSSCSSFLSASSGNLSRRSSVVLPLVTLVPWSSSSSDAASWDEPLRTPVKELRRCSSKLHKFHFPARNFLPEVRRAAAKTIAHWWHTRGQREAKRILTALKRIQRVGRCYLAWKRIQRRNDILRDSSTSMNRSIRFHSSISTQLHKMRGASISHIPLDGPGISFYPYESLSNYQQSLRGRLHSTLSRSNARNFSPTICSAGRSFCGTRLTNFGIKSSTEIYEESKNISVGDTNSPPSQPYGGNSELPKSPIKTLEQSVYSMSAQYPFSFLTRKVEDEEKDEEKGREAERKEERKGKRRETEVERMMMMMASPENEAFCCMLSNRISLKPFSVKVARSSLSSDFDDLGSWRRESARRSAIERLNPNPPLV